MKVALIDPSLFTWPYDSALALALRDAGHQVRIFGKTLPATEGGEAQDLLVPHFYRGMGEKAESGLARALFFARKGLSHAAAMRALPAQLRAFGPDVIHFQWTPLPAVDRWFLSALRTIAPLVLTVHDSMPFNGNARSFLQAAGATSIMTRFDRVLVHTEQAAARLRSYGVEPDRIRRVPHGTLDEVRASGVATGTKASSDSDVVSILLFGRIKPYKGADVLLRAAAKLPVELRNRFRIRIVGEAYMDLEPLRTLVRESGLDAQVELDPRFVEDDEVDTILQSADIIALPYREIDASGVLMKSLAAAAPIVASKIGLFAEMLVDGEHGHLVPPDDESALAAALEPLIRDSALRARMGAAVLRLRDEIPSWSSIASLTTTIYREVAVPTRDALTTAMEV